MDGAGKSPAEFELNMYFHGGRGALTRIYEGREYDPKELELRTSDDIVIKYELSGVESR